jgi:transcription antitermination factor NusG
VPSYGAVKKKTPTRPLRPSTGRSANRRADLEAKGHARIRTYWRKQQRQAWLPPVNASMPRWAVGETEEFCRAPWFAIRVKSNFEKKVATCLRNKGLEEFLPLYQSRRRLSDRYKTVDLPLFPGYLFCRLDLEHRLPLLTTVGFLYIVSVGNKPMPVDEDEIAAVQFVVRSGVPAMPFPSLAIGQRVRLEGGPLCGLEGAVVREGMCDRICVSVTLLQRGVSVEVDRDWIRPLSPARIPPTHSSVVFPKSRNLSGRA